MKKIVLSIILLIVIVLCSCNTNFDLDFDSNKDEYNQAVNCLYKNYKFLFPPGQNKASIDVYNSERVTNEVCGSVINLLEKHSVSIISYDRDSTIWFYSKVIKGL